MVAYASTGRLNGSEDLAQEAFVTAWQSIRELRDPSKFRSWLCGIQRNLANNAYRRRHRDILRQVDDITGWQVEATNVDSALLSIAHEEADLTDRTLVTLPENVREPLVLYYRWLLILITFARLLLSLRLVQSSNETPPLHEGGNYPQ